MLRITSFILMTLLTAHCGGEAEKDTEEAPAAAEESNKQWLVDPSDKKTEVDPNEALKKAELDREKAKRDAAFNPNITIGEPKIGDNLLYNCKWSPERNGSGSVRKCKMNQGIVSKNKEGFYKFTIKLLYNCPPYPPKPSFCTKSGGCKILPPDRRNHYVGRSGYTRVNYKNAEGTMTIVGQAPLYIRDLTPSKTRTRSHDAACSIKLVELTEELLAPADQEVK